MSPAPEFAVSREAVLWRAHRGTHDPANLVLVCGNHHRAIHKRRLFVSGTAPHDLHFQHADGQPYGAPPPRAEAPTAHVGTLAELSAFVDACLAREVRCP